MSTSLTLHCPAGNFRAFKALIAAEYCGLGDAVSVPPFADGEENSADFKAKSPLGRVPVLETSTGSITQSNTIARYIARLRPEAGLLGGTLQEQTEVDQWLDFTTNEIEMPATMWYYPIFGWMEANEDTRKEAQDQLVNSLKYVDAHLSLRTFLVGNRVSLADIVLASALVYPMKLVLDNKLRKQFGNVTRWFTTCVAQPQFEAVIGTVTLCKKAMVAKGGKKKAAKKQEKKKEKKKQEKKKEEKPKAVKDILGSLPKSSMSLDEWKKIYSNVPKNAEGKATCEPWFTENFDWEGYSLWLCKYDYDSDNSILWQTSNLVTGFVSRCDELRKFAFGTVSLLCKKGEDGSPQGGVGNIFLRGAFLIRSQDGDKYMKKVNPDSEYWSFTKVEKGNADGLKKVFEEWAKIYENDERHDGLIVYDAQEFK